MKSSRRTIARDISWLSFNARVLQEASDPNNYIYERLKFIGIFSNNQDEFFRVRVATLSRMVRLGKAARVHLEQNPGKILDKIQQLVIYQQTVFDETFSEIISELEKKNIYIKTERQLSKEQKEFVTGYFNDKVRTQIIPLMMESIPEMPYLRDKSIYLACVLGNTKNPMLQRYALIEIPRTVLPRFIIMPSEPGQHDIILLEDIIRYNLPNLFAPFGFNRFLGYIIKVTRDAELDVDNDISTNVIDELEKGLKNRKKGRATRFVFDRNIDGNLLNYLTKRLQLSKNDNLIPGGRIHNFKDFMEFPSSVFDDLQSRPKPFVHPFLHQPCRIMEVMEKQDIMLNFPYHSFDPIIDLLREAAIDPFVQSIKITCYRLAKDSKIINALINAVRNGKSVTVVLELWARFDEEANLKWKERLEEEGVNVLLGIPNMKVHAKICVIKKREFKSTKQYAFISTGNFNESTAKVYGDTCLLTTNRSFIADINRVFTVLENSKPSFDLLQKCTVLPVSPINMRDYFVAMIDKEIKAAKKGHEASIIIKLNSLVDEILIGKLYDAAKVGVDVKLIIRSNCCTVSEQKGFQKPIYAISIVDGYLEHSRIFVFHNGGDPKVFISSADWMVRNLDHRIEVACPILDKNIKQELIDILNIQLSGNVKARILDNEQKNEYVHREEGEPIVRAQEAIYEYLYNKQYKKTLILAAIDIGSNAARLLIVEASPYKDGSVDYTKLTLLRIPLRLGFDVFNDGTIADEKRKKLVDTIKIYKLLMDIYNVEAFEACATSAMRDASNGKRILSEIKKETGIDINIITGQEEANILYETHIAENLQEDKPYLYIDVGGGSTEVTLFADNHTIFKESFNIGTIRLLNNKVSDEQWEHMKWYIKTHTKDYQPLEAIGTGGNINKIFSVSKRKEGKYLTLELLKDYYKELSASTVEERMHLYNFRADRADVIVPALQIYTSLMKWAGAEIIYVPKIGLADGLVRMIYQRLSAEKQMS